MHLARRLRLLTPLPLALLLGAAPPAPAAEAVEVAGTAPIADAADTADAPALRDDRLYRALGAEAGIARITGDFIANLQADPRTRPYFVQASIPRLRTKLAEHVCDVSGGPCRYTGSSMKNVHSNLHIDRAAFNAVVENLQDAMEKNGIPFASQNALLARLAPLHRDIETR